MLDRSHEPSVLSQASSECILSLRFWSPISSAPSAVATGALAVGDTVGVLHILELPRNLRRPAANEKDTMAQFFNREVTRYDYNSRLVAEREAAIQKLDEEEKEAAEKEAEAAAKAAAAAAKAAAEEEAALLEGEQSEEKPAAKEMVEAAKHDKEYRVLEQQLLGELGLLGGDEEDHI